MGRWSTRDGFGTGFNDAKLKELHGLLDPIIRSDPLCAGPVFAPGDEPRTSEQIPETSTTIWTDAVHVVEVKYREFTPDGLLRHATFVRLRTDKQSARGASGKDGVRRPRPGEAQGNGAEPGVAAVDASDLDGAETSAAARRDNATASHDPPAPPARGPVLKNIAFSNLKKLYWPAEKYTKGDLVEYYRAVSKWLLPYLVNRPVVLTRFPDGIDGKSFYQRMRRCSRLSGCARFRSGARRPSARSAISYATTKNRFSTSPTWDRFRYTSGRVAWDRWSCRTGA